MECLNSNKMWRRARKRVSGMKLLKKPVISSLAKSLYEEEPKVQVKPAKKQKQLPPDVYADEIEPVEVVLDESRKIIVSVKRGGDLGLPCLDIRQFATTDTYTGFTKKGINFPLNRLIDIIDCLQEALERSEEKNLFEDFEDE